MAPQIQGGFSSAEDALDTPRLPPMLLTPGEDTVAAFVGKLRLEQNGKPGCGPAHHRYIDWLQTDAPKEKIGEVQQLIRAEASRNSSWQSVQGDSRPKPGLELAGKPAHGKGTTPRLRQPLAPGLRTNGGPLLHGMMRDACCGRGKGE
jgi:hypothetical protein